MNMMNTRSENRFVRKDLAVAIALVIASFGATGSEITESGSVASTKSSEPLPTLTDPAGIIDPELLAILNSMSNTEDYATSDVPEEIANQIKQQILERGRTDVPTLGAAQPGTATQRTAEPLFPSQNSSRNSRDESPSTVPRATATRSSALREIDVNQSDDSSDISNTGKTNVKEASERPKETDVASVLGRLIVPHLPSPVVPESEKSDATLRTLRFGDMLALSLVGNPGIVMAEERVEQAIENANQVGAFRYPLMAATSTVGPEYNDPVASEESGVATTIGKNVKVTLTHQLYDGGTARSTFNRAKQLIGAAEAESQIELESLLLEIVINYIDYWRFQVELGQAEVFVEVMNDLVNDLDAMFRAGATSKLEVDFARARVASARGVRTEATASMNNAFSELEYLVPGLASFTASSPEKFSDFLLLSLDEYMEKGASANSRFKTNKINIEATKQKIRATKGMFKPTVNVELSGSYIDDEGQPSVPRLKAAAKFLLNYTFYSGGERRAGVRRAQAQLREFQSERIQLERDVFREIDQSFNNITSSRLALDAVNDEIIAHEELQRLNKQNLALGTVNIMELIDVEERLFNASSRKNEVLATLYQEYFTLSVSAGFTEDILSKYDVKFAPRQ